MNQKKVIQILIGVVAVLVVVLIMDIVDNMTNRGVIKQLQKELDTEKKESQVRVDSLNDAIELKEFAYIKKIRILEAQKDSVRELYEKSKTELNGIQKDITKYLNSSDAVRFAKFKQLLTQVD